MGSMRYLNKPHEQDEPGRDPVSLPGVLPLGVGQLGTALGRAEADDGDSTRLDVE